MYAVGIDIGTTYTAAAVWRDGRAEIAALGSHSAAIPSVVFLRSDGTFLTGESAGRRGLSEPGRVAREFKRNLSDTSPTLLGGSPYSASALTARMLKAVLDAVTSREGGPPASICVSHPASWGPYKIDRLRQAVRLADIEQPVQFTTEAQAAASYYAHQHRLEPGAVLAVYDLGGGTFDAAVLRKTADGFDLTGQPEEIEPLGGIEFDAAIFAHVAASVGGPLERLDPDDPALNVAVAQLRAECVQAKEALSADTEAAIQVLLPTVSTKVQLTRSELEAMVRPAVQDSIEALRRTIRSAGYAPQALSAVLLVGGSSRMPIVAQMVGSELGRPVAVDANPKHAVALGAAWQAGSSVGGSEPVPATPEPVDPEVRGAAAQPPIPVITPKPVSTQPVSTPKPVTTQPVSTPEPVSTQPVSRPKPVGTPKAADPPVPDAAGQPPIPPIPVITPAGPIPDAYDEPTGEIPVLAGSTAKMPKPAAAADARPPLPKATVTARVAMGSAAETGHGTPAPGSPPPPGSPPVLLGSPPPQPANNVKRRVLVAAVAVLLLAGGGTAWALTRSNAGDDTATQVAADQQQSEQATAPSSAAASSAPAAAGDIPADEQCTDEMKKSTRWVCITKATLTNNTFTVWYDAEWNGSTPNRRTGFHLHLYGGDGTNPDESTMGSQAVVHSKYYFEDQQPSVRKTSSDDFAAIGNAKKVCARIAQTGHGLAKAYDGSYHTGNCIPIQRS